MEGVNIFLALLFICSCVTAHHEAFFMMKPPERPALIPKVYSGEPLFLTPYIEGGVIDLGQSLAKVNLKDSNVDSYSGFITVNKKYDSNMFFWYIPAENGDTNAPLVIWLQGGPGASSMFGLLTENGPFSVNKNLKLVPREYSWSRTFSTLFIDNPVGSGFSYTKSDDGYATSQDDVGRDLYSFLVQFYALFPYMHQNDLYISGESYAGKYVPAISHYIHTQNQKPDNTFKINFKGMAIGNGVSDPVSMADYADYLYQIGLLDREERKIFRKQELVIIDLIKKEKWDKSLLAWDQQMQEVFNLTGFRDYYNFLQPPLTDSEIYLTSFLNQPRVRQGIHVGNVIFNDTALLVHSHLRGEMTKSVKPLVEDLLNHGYKVLFYNGQLDICVAYPLTESFLWSMDDWKLIHPYRHSGRKIWRVGNEIAGYAKKVGNLQQVLVRNSGHMVPKDQPKWAYDLLHRFINDKPF